MTFPSPSSGQLHLEVGLIGTRPSGLEKRRFKRIDKVFIKKESGAQEDVPKRATKKRRLK